MFNQIRETSDILHRALDGLSVRQRVISNNLANAETPNFKASEVIFEAQLQRRLARMNAQKTSLESHSTHESHIPLSEVTLDNGYQEPPIAIMQPKTSMRNDGNSVDLELENTRMAQASISYTAVSQMLSGSYSGLKYVIQEGGK
jgi:flagellar basal-body rod protein FlgB